MTLSKPQLEIVPLEKAYEVAHERAILVDRSKLGMLKFTGKTRLDLINRMSTQKVIDLQSGSGAATILTSDIGRIIDRLILYASSDAVYCLTSEDNGENIAGYLRRFIFYMDDFHIEDLGNRTAILAVYGQEAESILARSFGESTRLALHHWKQVDWTGTTVYLHRTDPVAGDGYFVICQVDDKAAVWDWLVASGITPAGEESFEYLRIESGQPRFGHELALDYIPLEANLWPDVSFNKGCYTGQEIIARMESRGRLAKKLVRLKSNDSIAVGAELMAESKKVGTITSASGGPKGYLALGFVKTSILAEATSPAEMPVLMAGQATLEMQEL